MTTWSDPAHGSWRSGLPFVSVWVHSWDQNCIDKRQ
jgi:hypothetical protein